MYLNCAWYWYLKPYYLGNLRFLGLVEAYMISEFRVEGLGFTVNPKPRN